MAFPPVYNPPVPYKGYLPMPPAHGSSIIVNGTIPHHCKRFHINLETDNGDIALHFNPRFEGTNQVVRNTRRSGRWEQEERHGSFPFYKGVPFEVMILIEDIQYKIAVNGCHFTEYRHRIPKDYVRHISVNGDVQISQIRFQGGSVPAYNPAGAVPGPPSYNPPGAVPCPPVYNPPMPYVGPIPGGMYPVKTIKINGTPSFNASRFNVNLVCGPGYASNADLGLHMDARFHYGNDHNIVVRNSKQNGQWGQEERHSQFFPFVPNVPFEMLVRCEHDMFKIAVNNQHMFEFRHRLHPLQRLDHLAIGGDVAIGAIQFI